MLSKIIQKIKSVGFYKKTVIYFATSAVFFSLALIQIILLLFRRTEHFGECILIIIIDIIVAALFLAANLINRKRDSSNKISQ